MALEIQLPYKSNCLSKHFKQAFPHHFTSKDNIYYKRLLNRFKTSLISIQIYSMTGTVREATVFKPSHFTLLIPWE